MALVPPLYLIPLYKYANLAAGLLYTLFVGQDAARLVANLAAASFAGWAFSVDAQSRLMKTLATTPLSVEQIAGIKLGVVLHQVRVPVIVAVAVRILLAVVAWIRPDLPAALFMSTASLALGRLPPAVPRFVLTISQTGYSALEAAFRQFEMLHYLAVWVPWLTYYVLQPGLDVVLFAAAGMLFASHVRTQNEGLAVAFSAALAMLIFGYLGERALSVGLAWLLPGAGTQAPTIIPLPVWAFGLPAVSSGFIAIYGFAKWLVFPIIAVKLAALWVLLSGGRKRAHSLRQGAT